MKYSPVQHPPLTALELLERQAIDFTDYGLLAWLKSQESAVEVREMIRISGCRLAQVSDALENLESAGLIASAVEDALPKMQKPVGSTI